MALVPRSVPLSLRGFVMVPNTILDVSPTPPDQTPAGVGGGGLAHLYKVPKGAEGLRCDEQGQGGRGSRGPSGTGESEQRRGGHVGARARLWWTGPGSEIPAQRSSALMPVGGWLEPSVIGMWGQGGGGRGAPGGLTPGTWPWTRCTGSRRCRLAGCGAGQPGGRRASRCPGRPSWRAGRGLGRPRG